MADPTKAWDKAFTSGSKVMQDRLKKVHAKNPAFQSWLKSSGHGAGESVKQASKEVKPTVRAKQLAAASATAYGATKGLAVGGEHGGAGVAQKVDKGRVWSPDEVAALNKQRGTEPVQLTPAQKRMAAIKAAAEKSVAKKAKSFDVPTLQRQHDDLRDVHDSLHSRVTRSSMDEEVEQVVAEGLNEMDKSQTPPGRDGGHQFGPGPKVSKKVTKAVNKDPAKHLSDLFAKEYDKKKQGMAEGIEGVELEEGKYASTIAAIAAQAYEPKVGDKVRTRKGGQIPGKVEKIEGNRIFFRHPEGKLYATHSSNLMREEVEQIDELKKKTLQSYKSKAQNEIESMAKDLRGKEYQTVNPQKIKNRASGIKLATAKLKKEEVESVNEDQAADWQKVQSMEKGSIIGGKDAMRTHLKYLNAVHAHQKKHGLDTVKTKKKIEGINRTLVQMGEEVEQIDEGNVYHWDKLVKIHLKDAKNSNNTRKQRKHAESMASRALEASKMSDFDKAYRHYMGVGVGDNLDEEVEQIDEVTKQEAEKALGGPVKEKPTMPPGKQPAGHRYVRNLARKAMKKGMKEEVEQVVEQDETMEKVEMAQTQLHFICYAANEIIEFVKMGGEVEEWYQNKLSKVHSDMESLHSYIEGEKRRTGMVKEDAEQVDEKAPPGAKYERMVKHIKAKYAKDGLTDKEKSIAYATAWKAYGKKNEETVTEAEGKVAVTPKEKDLAAHHGDPTRITYGDVIKARLKSAAAKKMGK